MAVVEGDEAIRLYHRLTSYEPEREWTTPVEHPLLLTDFVPNDRPRLPPFAKVYAGDLPTVALPRELPRSAVPATAALAGTPVPPGRLDLPGLARLLHLSAGIVRIAQHGDRRMRLRASGSAGGRFPVELYVAARDVDGLDDGVHRYDPVAHALVRIGPPPGPGATTIVLTGVPWRTGWRYAERGFRHLYWDAGTVTSQLLALAASAGLPAALRTTFPDGTVTALVGADGVHEFPLALVTLGDGAPAVEPGGPAAAGRVDDEPLEFPLVTLAQRAGDGAVLGAPWPAGEPLPGGPPVSVPLDEVIAERTSSRRLVRGAPVPSALLEWPMAAATRGLPDGHWVAVHAVDGRAAGLYRWPDLEAPRRRGDLRDELFRVCLDQALAGDASYVVITTAVVDRLTARGYRAAQLGAGIVSGRLHLAAHALGFGATGMTFLDSEIAGFLGADEDALLMTCLGVMPYRPTAGGPPGEPVTVTTVRPL